MLVFIKDKCDNVNKFFKDIFSSDFDKLIKSIDCIDIETVKKILFKKIGNLINILNRLKWVFE